MDADQHPSLIVAEIALDDTLPQEERLQREAERRAREVIAFFDDLADQVYYSPDPVTGKPVKESVRDVRNRIASLPPEQVTAHWDELMFLSRLPMFYEVEQTVVALAPPPDILGVTNEAEIYDVHRTLESGDTEEEIGLTHEAAAALVLEWAEPTDVVSVEVTAGGLRR